MLINIIFIIPYPELEEKVNKIFQNHPLRARLRKRIEMRTADELETFSFNAHSDVIIARGYTACGLRKMTPELPIIELPITAYDLIRALNECITLYSPKKVAFIGNYTALSEADELGNFVNCDIKSYHSESTDDITKAIDQAVADGYTAFIGGYSVNLICSQRRLPSVTIRTGNEAITRALDEAVRTVDVVRMERERSAMFTTITQTAMDGVLYVDIQQTIKICNPAALKMYTGPKKKLQGLSLQSAFPFLSEPVSTVINTGTELPNQLIRWKNYTINATIHPVIINSRITGIVVTFQDVTQIQQVEIQIRKKMTDKGLNAHYHFNDIIHDSPEIDYVIEKAKKFASVSSNILIEGETGTGKELFAQSIHNASTRCNGPFVAVNCAALPENLLESELFGYVEGAFTGTAKGGKTGLFELAHKGTLFLDEISEIPLSIQGKLLRVLQEHEVRRVGGDRVISVDVRIIAATNHSLSRITEQGRFRQDLLYRLNVLKLFLPPLRRRCGDTKILFLNYLNLYYRQLGRIIPHVATAAIQMLSDYHFPGNIRELRNVTERLVVICMDKEEITADDMREALHPEELPVKFQSTDMPIPPFYQDGEREFLIRMLEESNYNQTLTAEKLGINRTTLWRRMKKHGIRRP